jgi:hypothetical protein
VIVFDLKCGRAHVFEAWFGSSADYENQRERGLIQCPVCGDGEIAKAVMAPRLGGKAAGEPDTAMPVATGDAPELKAMMAKMAELQSRMLQDSEWVGTRFADEARAIHHGETGHRTIHGQATPAEAAALKEEGVGLMPLPFPVVPPEQTH